MNNEFTANVPEFELDPADAEVLKKSLESAANLQQEAIAQDKKEKEFLQADEETEIADPENSSNEEEEEPLELTNTEIKKEQPEDKSWKIKRRYFQAVAERDGVMEENARLREIINRVADVADINHEQLVLAELEKAKENKRKSIEEGDIEQVINADIALGEAVHKLQEIKKYKLENIIPKAPQPQTPQPTSPSNYALYQEIAQDWIEKHNYLDANSKDYDPNLASEVGKFVSALDQNLVNSGQQAAYFSEEYFDVIDQHIHNLRSQKRVKNNISNAMPVGGVRNSYNNSTNNRSNRNSISNVKLSDAEKAMARSAEIPEAVWLKYKIADLQQQHNNQRGR